MRPKALVQALHVGVRYVEAAIGVEEGALSVGLRLAQVPNYTYQL